MLKYVYNLNSVQYEQKVFFFNRNADTLLLCIKTSDYFSCVQIYPYLVRMESTRRKA
jgi:hypothetical protein